jgi:hypothetical protein
MQLMAADAKICVSGAGLDAVPYSAQIAIALWRVLFDFLSS